MGYNNSRKQLRRILSLAKHLKSANGLKVKDLADFYAVDMTRIYDDLKVLKDFYEVKKEGTLYSIEPDRPLRWPKITKPEADALEKVINASPLAKDPVFEKYLNSALGKLHRKLPEYIQDRMENGVSTQLKSGTAYTEIEEQFRTLEEALYTQKVARAHYQPGGKTETVEHLLQPYAIFFRKADWYLEAYSNLSENESLTFKILRFRNVQLTDETFELPEDFSLSTSLESRWELFSGEPIQVKLKIASNKAYLVEEKKRHATQKILERGADGSVIVSYTLPKQEFMFWVLSLGDAAEILEPPGFRTEFQKIVQRMHALYLPDGEK